MEQEPTIDDLWINGLANKIGVLTAQNDRLMLEIEQLKKKLEELQPTVPLNGELVT